MAVTFEITSSREVTINGIGLLRENEPITVTDSMADHFESEQGYPLTEANFPNFVKVTAVLGEGNENTDREKEV